MRDILQRLRCTVPCQDMTAKAGCHCAEAADTVTALRAEVERLKELAVKADEAIVRQQQDLDEAADRAADCDILRAEVDTAAEMLREAKARNTDLTARVAKLEGALIGVLWMAEEWFKHGGDETTFADDYEAKLEAARATITKGEREG